MSNQETQTDTGARPLAVPLDRLVRQFHLVFAGTDNRGGLQLGEATFTSVTGKLTQDDLRHTKVERCKVLRSEGIEIYPDKMMITFIYELDA